jgi:signal transduction histidine kinase
MRTRNWSIRAKIVSLLLVPLITLIAMWALATAVTVRPGLDLLDAQNNVDNIGHPAEVLVNQVQQERRLSLIFLASGRRDQDTLNAQRAETDAAATTFRRLSGGSDALAAATPLTRQRLTELTSMLDSLPRQRESIDRGELDRSGTMRFYTELIGEAHLLYGSIIRLADEDLARQARALLAMDRAAEVMAQEDTYVGAAFAAGVFSGSDLAQTEQLIGAARFQFADALPNLYPDDFAGYQALTRSDGFVRLTQLENRILTDAKAGAQPPVDTGSWRASYGTVSAGLRDLRTKAENSLIERTAPTALATFGNIALAGLLGLVTVVVTVVASIRIGRNLIKRLAGLRQAALELAVDRLPRVVARLRAGEQVDVLHEAPDLPYGDDEIGQVGHAFNEVQRTAVNSAVDEAVVRRGLNEVFLNIARRSQTLLHRQLTILDRMERRADDPTELEDLFRVDHLATRMRRHAEDLVILAGAAPGRGWRNPVPIVDVLRGAVSEVEDYARVSIRPMPDVSLAGRAVGDVIHLLAELIENSTSFSPPHTRVNVGGEIVAHGLAIEIEDRGLGMSPESLADANERLVNPPEFDPANSAQLGLFVVARLAARHGVKVGLRTSPYGGVTAVALIPEELVVSTGRASRDAVAALPAGRTAGSTTSGGTTPGGPSVTRQPSYREISTAARPAIAARPRGGDGSSGSATAAALAEPATAGASAMTVHQAQVREAARHARQEIVDPPTSTGQDGLPRRVRQSSIAPQLRDGPKSTSDGNQTQAEPARSPEQVRAMMSSFQAGLNRGRQEAETVADVSSGGASERDA